MAQRKGILVVDLSASRVWKVNLAQLKAPPSEPCLVSGYNVPFSLQSLAPQSAAYPTVHFALLFGHDSPRLEDLMDDRLRPKSLFHSKGSPQIEHLSERAQIG